MAANHILPGHRFGCTLQLQRHTIPGRQTPTVSFTIITIGLSAIIALILMPFTYEKAIDPATPFVVQLGIYVQTGVFWSVTLTLIGKAYG